MTKTDYENLKVSTLREMSKERGMTLEHKGHKFNKAELIERLKNYDKETSEVVEKQHTENETKELCDFEETKTENNKSVVFRPENRRQPISLEELKEKYLYKRDEWVYDNLLRVNCFVVFVQCGESLDGYLYEKLRTAKVIAVNRTKRLVKVEMFLGDEIMLGFEDIMYIRPDYYGSKYPFDIKEYLRSQRTRKGRELINERFGNTQ